MRAGVALGSNLGDRLAALTNARSAIFALAVAEPPLLSSSLYETEAVDCEKGAEKFLNAVIELRFNGPSHELLRELQQIENALGRPSPHESNRSRTIDLDLLYHGNHTIDQPHLTLPHPRAQLRAFVLAPLAEIRPNLILPNERKTVRQLADELEPIRSVVRLSLQW